MAFATSINVRRLPVALLALVMLAGVALLAAGPVIQLPQPKFRSGVDLVALDICVKDRNGRFIPGLTADEFLVLENNRLRKIEFFSADGGVPLAVVMLVDRSASMADRKLERAKAAARTFIQRLRPEDLLEVIAFGDRADRRLSFSTDRAAAEQAVAELSAHGATALFDSLAVALRDLEHGRRRAAIDYRQAIIIVSDGEPARS
jgi:VWFA-related protein